MAVLRYSNTKIAAITNDCQESHHADTGMSFDLQVTVGMKF